MSSHAASRNASSHKSSAPAWAGDITDTPPVKLDSIIDTTPVWKPIVEALRTLAPGGRLVINAIRKEELDKASLTEIDYPSQLWLEKRDQEYRQYHPSGCHRILTDRCQIPLRVPRSRNTPWSRRIWPYGDEKPEIRGAQVLLVLKLTQPGV